MGKKEFKIDTLFVYKKKFIFCNLTIILYV